MAAGSETVDRADPRDAKAGALEENLGSAAVELTADDLSEIETAASEIAIQGARLPAAVLALSGR